MDHNRLQCNDVHIVADCLGIEAARATLMREIGAVFGNSRLFDCFVDIDWEYDECKGAYGISVDPRHLGLVADFMTREYASSLLL